MKISIKLKLIILGTSLILLLSLVLGTFAVTSARVAIYNGIDDRLMDQAKDWALIVNSYQKEIEGQEKRVRRSAENIVSAQAKIIYELIDETLEEQGNTLPEASKEDIFMRLNRNTVGGTGYSWILDYEGNYILSKGRQRDGENILNEQDSNGNFMVQEIIEKGKAVKGPEIAYHSYFWQNKGEDEPREKISAIIHFPELGWIVGASTYYDDIVEMYYEQKTKNYVEDLVSRQTIGRSGYIWIVDSNGKYIVSKNRLRDGEDISMSKDSNGFLFIKEAIKRAKTAQINETALITYPWKNKGENESRTKVAGLSYNEEWDWIIGVSAYYDDFEGEGYLGIVQNTVTYVGIIATIIAALAMFIFGHRIVWTLKKMKEAGQKISKGDLTAELPQIKSHDELEELNYTMETLIGALKYYKNNKK